MLSPQTQSPPGKVGSAVQHATGQAQANGNAADVYTSTPRMLAEAIRLSDLGYAVHWLKPAKKEPIGNRWQLVAVMDVDALRASYRLGQNVGIRCGRWSHPKPGYGLVILDLDAVDAQAAQECYAAAEGLFGELDRFPTVRSGSGHGLHLYAVVDLACLPASQDAAKSGDMVKINGKAKHRWRIQILSTGAQVVAPPSVHPDTGAEYQWIGHGLTLALPELCDELSDLRPESDGADASTLPPVVEAIDVGALQLHQWQLEMIRTGTNAKGSRDRSAVLYAVLRDLVTADATDGQMLGICTDPANGISAKPLEKRNPCAWLLPQVRKARREIEQEHADLMANVDALLRKGKTAEAQALLSGKPTPKGREYRLDPVGELIANIKPTPYLVKGVVPANTTGMIVGASRSGKSFIEIDMTACIGTGRDWHGHKVTQGPVVYLAGEGHNGIVKRFKAWSIHNGVDLTDAPLFVSNRAITLDAAGAATVAAVIAEATSTPPVLIVVDTMHRHYVGKENSNDDFGVFLNTAESIARSIGAALSIVHHTGHEGEHGRGASAQLPALDWSYAVSRVEGGPITLKCTKSKDSEEPPPKLFRLHKIELPIVDEDGEHETSAVIRLDAVQESPDEQRLGANQLLICTKLRELTRKAEQCGIEGGVTVDELRDAVGMDRRRWADALDTLTKRAVLKIEGNFIRLVVQTPP